MKGLAFAVAFLASSAAQTAEPDGLILPPGFHAQVVASGLTGVRHLAFRPNGDLYVSTRGAGAAPGTGIIAIRFNRLHQAAQIERFGDVRNGSGIRFYHGALYASSPTGVYKFRFGGPRLLPSDPPTMVVSGMPTTGFVNRMLAFDDKGGLFVAVGGSGNICATKPAEGARPVGLMPCPDLAGRSGIWRFDAIRPDQHFPADGARVAVGVRDLDALDWRRGDALYAVMHGRNGTAETWPDQVKPADDDAVAEEMHRVVEGADLGWPYTYYDQVRRVRVQAPEYKTNGPARSAGNYAAPVVAFPGHEAPIDMVFYHGHAFPAAYRGGAFVAFHGSSAAAVPGGHPGFNVSFVAFDSHGKPGAWTIFADGFAGADAASRNAATAAYRPVGLAVAPDGGLYVADSNKGRIWRITYRK